MNYVEESTSSHIQPSRSEFSDDSSKSLVKNALEANKHYQRILIQRAEQLEAKLKEADQLLAAASVEESQDEPESEILIPGAKKATGLFPSAEFLNPASPFYEEAMERSSYLTNTNPHPLKTKEIETLSDAVRQENERLQAYNRSQDLGSGSGKPIDLEKNTEGLDWSKVAEKVSDASSVNRSAVDCQIVWIADKHPAVNHAEWSEDELNKLNLLVSQYTKEKTAVDWVKVSENLGTHRIPIDCMRHGVPRHRHTWSAETDQKLVQAVESCGQDSWQLVARKVSENVSAAQCQIRWQKTLNPKLRKGVWTEGEDDRLRKAVAGYGPSWIQVAAAIPGRTNDQCRERWTEYLTNASAKIIWTEEEDKALLDSVKECGNQWKLISLTIGNNKTGQNCRTRYDKLKRMQNNPHVDSPASVTAFINSTLSQLAEVQSALAQHAAISSPTANNQERESEPTAPGPKPRPRPRVKGKGKEKALSLDNTHPSEALHPSESSTATNLMDVSEETITTTTARPNQPVTGSSGGSHEPVSKPRPRPRPKAKGKTPSDALFKSGTSQSNDDPNRSGTSRKIQPTATVPVTGFGSMVETSSTANTKRKAVDEADSTDGSQPKKLKASHVVDPSQLEPSQPSQITPASTSSNVGDVSPTPQLSSQPKKWGRPHKVVPPPERERENATTTAESLPLISMASENTSIRRTRAQTRAAQRRLESSS